MSVTQYIGARYVPSFGRLGELSIEWDNTGEYEPLTIVLHQGNSYTSRQFVPKGIDIGNKDYWALTGNYNAQIEQYRQELKTVSDKVDGQDAEIESAVEKAESAIAKADKAETDINPDSTTVFGTAAYLDVVNNVVKDNLQPITSGAVSSYVENLGNIFASNYYSKQQSDDRYQLKQSGEALKLACIGDSFLDGYTPEGNVSSWGTQIASKLGCPVHNYSKGGIGFVQSIDNTTVKTLLGSAYAELGSDVDIIIIGAGINDRSKTASQMYSAALDTFEQARNWFPSAEIWVFPNLWGCKGYNVNAEELANRVAFAAEKMGTAVKPINVCMGAWTWLYLRTSDVASDGIHPLQTGQNMIANAMISRMNGGDPTIRYWQVAGSESGVVWQLNYLTLTLQCANVSYSNDDYFATFPTGLKPYSCVGQFLFADNNSTDMGTVINGVSGMYVWQGTKSGSKGYCTVTSMLNDSL